MAGRPGTELNAACPGGVCTGTAGAAAVDVDGYFWASAIEVATLFNEFIGFPALDGTAGLHTEEDSTWAPLFLSFFDPTQFATGNDGGPGVGAWSSTSSNATEAFSGGIHDVSTGPAPGFEDAAGISSADKTFTAGAWMYRPGVPATPEEQVEDLADDVEDLGTGGALDSDQVNALTRKLDAIAASIGRGNRRASCGQLGAFINQVTSLRDSGDISAAQAGPLIGAADSLRNDIGCS